MDPSIPVTGWILEVINIIANELGICYEIVRMLSPGVKLPNGTYTGLTGLLNRHEIDMCLTPWIMSPAREEAFDFSTYIYIEQQELVAKRPKPEADIAGFIKPFPGFVWGYLLIGTLITLASFYGIYTAHWFIYGQRKGSSLVIKRESKSDENLSPVLQKSTVWLVAALLSQSIPFEPQRVPERIITTVWLIFTLIMGTLYRSNLKAMLISPKVVLPFNTLEEFVGSGQIVHVYEGSFVWGAVTDAPANSLLGRVRKYAIINADRNEAIAKVLKGELVGFFSAATNKYLMHMDFSRNGECNLFATYTDAMMQMPVGIPFPPGSKLLPKVNKIISRLREFGILDHLYQKQVVNSSECMRPVSATLSADALRPLELKAFYGVFSIYFGGMALGILAFGCELLTKHKQLLTA